MEPDNYEMALALDEVAADLIAVADHIRELKLDAQHRGSDAFEWKADWSTHTLAAYGAIYESLKH